MKHEKVIWNSATSQSFCPVCGHTSDLTDTREAQLELEKYECRPPYVETSGAPPGEETVRLIRKPFKMTIKTERSGSRFAVDNTDPGKPVLRLQLFHDTASSLKALSLGFELLSGTTAAQARTLVDAMNERIVGVIVTPNS